MAVRRRWALDRIEPVYDEVVGTNGDDTLTGTQDSDTIRGLLGRDLMEGLGGRDGLDGGKGRDTLVGGLGRDTLNGGPSDDVFRYEAVGDSRASNPDLITRYRGGDAIDTFAIDADKLTPGDQDFAYVAALTGVAGQLAWRSDGAGGTIIEGDVDGDGVADLRIEIQEDSRDSLAGTDGNDTLIGYDEGETIGGAARGSDLILGAGGNDSITGGVEPDTLDGGIGDDTIVGRASRDMIAGGEGDDELWGGGQGGFGTPSSSPDIIDGGAGNDTINAVAGSTVTGGAGDDSITAVDRNFASPIVSGGAGDDVIVIVRHSVFNGQRSDCHIFGEADEDWLSGGDGGETIDGGTGSDTLFGDKGEDTLIGGSGGDTLDGGEEPDVYIYQHIDDSTLADPDFFSALRDADTIDLSALDANGELAGDQAFARVEDFTGTAGELRLRLDGATGNTFIEGDVDGDAVADFLIVANGDRTDFTSFVL